MFNHIKNGRRAERHFGAISDSHAIIWFAPDGTIRGANANFCKALGYDISEIVGKHHKLFVEQAVIASPEYSNFWKDLAAGKPQRGQFRRISKSGADVWIEASYDPIIRNGVVTEVVKIAADITETKVASLHNENILRALERSVAVIADWRTLKRWPAIVMVASLGGPVVGATS